MKTNAFQSKDTNNSLVCSQKAHQEAVSVAEALKTHGVTVTVVEEAKLDKSKWVGDTSLPDACFPNNIVGFIQGKVILYPMCHKSRRAERQLLPHMLSALGKSATDVVDFASELERKEEFCEGTGSLVLDHVNKKLYACTSPRTTRKAIERISQQLQYEPFLFDAVDDHQVPIYHTNVMLTVGSTFAILCAESMMDVGVRHQLIKKLEGTGKDVIIVTYSQMKEFACNVLEIRANDNPLKTCIAMSKTASLALTTEQKQRLKDKHQCKLIVVDISTIERFGGGSIRCMLAEVFS